MSKPSNTDIVCVKGRSADGSDTKFYRRSNGVKLNGYKFIRTVKSKAENGHDFDEYVHPEDYDAYVKAYREAGLL